MKNRQFITEKELEVLEHLVSAWNIFLELERQHPMEVEDFCDGIHQCQRLLQARVARRAEPDIFPIKK